jgi:translation initiation factor 3 subunit A
MHAWPYGFWWVHWVSVGCTELISVGQKNSALDALETVIKSKRHRQWSPVLEDIVKKFLSLCTEARQPRRAREGLVQYRQITQSAADGPASVSKVVSTFVLGGEARVKEAEAKAGLGADAVANLQDLEAEETPETMMISVLTGDLSDTGRADRDNYVQWLKFLWESYRTCLEVLKNNAKLEELYADTAKKTFAFCVRYKRKVEFRRLKDLLKAHLSNNQLNTSYGAPTQVGPLPPSSAPPPLPAPRVRGLMTLLIHSTNPDDTVITSLPFFSEALRMLAV